MTELRNNTFEQQEWAARFAHQATGWRASLPEGATNLRLRVGHTDFSRAASLAVSDNARSEMRHTGKATILGLPIERTDGLGEGQATVCYDVPIDRLPG